MKDPLALCPRTVPRVLAIVIGLLVLAHIAAKISTIHFGRDMVHGLVPMFDLNEEANVPTFFSAMALLFAAVLFGIAGAVRWRTQAGDRVYWLALLLVFVYLGFDELFEMHERFNAPTRAVLDMPHRIYFAWTIPMGILTLTFGLLFLRFLRQLPPRIGKLFLLAGVLYVTGALGMEIVGGFIDRDPHNLARVFVNLVEEVLEMAGVVVLIRALLLYLEDLGVALHFGGTSVSQPER